DLQRNELNWSPEVFRIFEVEPEGFGSSYDEFLSIVHPDDLTMVKQAFTRSLESREDYDIVHRLLLDDGRVKWVNERCITHYDDEGKPLRSMGTVQDITIRKRAEDEMRLAASVFDNSLNGIMITGPDGNIHRVNRSFTEILGYSEAEVVGQTPRLLKSGHHEDSFFNEMWISLLKEGKWEGEIWDRRKDGTVIPVWQSISTVRDANGKVTHYIGILFDISEQKASAERIQHLAHYDVLTGLPNRALLLDRVEQAIARARREKSQFALMFLDLDRFKHINDTLGHPVGDGLLQAVAQRLQQTLREQDTVARLGGDEFIVLLEDLESDDHTKVAAQKLLAAFAQPFAVRKQTLSVGTTIGISLYPEHGEDVTSLLMHADLALYQAKEHGRGCFWFFETQFTDHATERMCLESDLRQALLHKQLELHYQPIYTLNDKQLVGAEALLRWHHPERGLVSPDTFIPIACDTGLIIPIGAWVLEEACRQAVRWHQEGLALGTMAVNLSGIQVQRGDIVNTVTAILKKTGMPAHCLELEITESEITRHAEQDLRQLAALHALGVEIAIDDFGTGQHSLGYLKKLPVSKIKIDRSFIEDTSDDANGEAITRAILGLGQGLNMTVVAEGVESQVQEQFLHKYSCDQVQGFHYSKPLDASAFTALLSPTKRTVSH
ncbi:MAG: EAL domain-containing protein, partial [Sedimenticola sp.]|nr:EAL domain-containing protein [Sedimenticola sp.]